MSGDLIGGLVLAVVGHGAWAYFHPFRDCPRCKATGRNRLSTARRRGKCSRCKGSREVRTLGAQLLHRAVRSAVTYHRTRKDR